MVIEVRAVQRVDGEGDWCGVLFNETKKEVNNVLQKLMRE
jgi:hypothetical protein